MVRKDEYRLPLFYCGLVEFIFYTLLRAEKLSVIQRLLQVNDESLIQAIQAMLDYALKNKNYPETDFGEALSQEQKEQVEAAIREINVGEGISHEEVMGGG